MYHNGLVVNMPESQSNNPILLTGWKRYDLLFHADIVNLLLKDHGRKTECLMLLFW